MNEEELKNAVKKFLEQGSFIKRQARFFPKTSIAYIAIDNLNLRIFPIGFKNSVDLCNISTDEHNNLYGTGRESLTI